MFGSFLCYQVLCLNIFRCVSISINSKFTDLLTNRHLAIYALLQPFGQSSMIKIVSRIVRIVTRIVRIITRIVRIIQTGNGKIPLIPSLWSKNSFYKMFHIWSNGFKTGNGIIQTGNGIISLTYKPLIKNTSLKRWFRLIQGVENLFSKHEME